MRSRFPCSLLRTPCTWQDPSLVLSARDRRRSDESSPTPQSLLLSRAGHHAVGHGATILMPESRTGRGIKSIQLYAYDLTTQVIGDRHQIGLQMRALYGSQQHCSLDKASSGCGRGRSFRMVTTRIKYRVLLQSCIIFAALRTPLVYSCRPPHIIMCTLCPFTESWARPRVHAAALHLFTCRCSQPILAPSRDRRVPPAHRPKEPQPSIPPTP